MYIICPEFFNSLQDVHYITGEFRHSVDLYVYNNYSVRSVAKHLRFSHVLSFIDIWFWGYVWWVNWNVELL